MNFVRLRDMLLEAGVYVRGKTERLVRASEVPGYGITRLFAIPLVGVLLVLGACANQELITPAFAAGQAVFTTSTLTIIPNVVGPDDKVYVSVKVRNNGRQAGVYLVILKVQNNANNKLDVQTQTVTLAGGASQKVTFTISADEWGTYTVMIDQLIGSFLNDPERQ